LFSETEAAEKRRKEKEEHSVDAYESKFKQIQEISHEKDLEKLVDKFIEGLILNFFFVFLFHLKSNFYLVEDKNFALFNYVNELNNQIEILQEQIAEIKKEIRRFEGQGVELEDKQKRMLEQIDDKRLQGNTLADEYEEKTRTARKILDQCRAG
jgi:hypothetical protein